jgi:Ca-activated chloride channel family protein
MFLNAMHPDMMPLQGTDLGEALRVSLDALDQGARDARVIVLVTDGEDHEGRFAEQLQRAREAGVQIFVVGIGSPDGVPIPVYDERGSRQGFLRDEDGAVVTTRLEEATLRGLVQSGSGTYVRAGAGGTAFDELVDRVARGADGEAIEERQITQFEEQYQIFLAVALLLLFAEWMVSDRKRAEVAWAGRFE